MSVQNVIRIILVMCVVGKVRNGGPEQTTEKETRPEYIHPDGLLNFDPYLSDFKPVEEEDDYIPLPENDETIDGLPIFLVEPKNSFVLRSKPATLLCRAANALQVYFKCNDVRTDKTVQLEHVDPQNGVRVVEAELNITRNELDEYFGGKYSCECYAWNSKGRIRSQGVFIEFAYIKKQFSQQPQSVTAEAGRQVTFHCSPPPSAPPATIKWIRNGLTIEPTDETLVLPRVGIQDMANYTCIAENIAGRRESDVAVLSVYGKECLFFIEDIFIYSRSCISFANIDSMAVGLTGVPGFLVGVDPRPVEDGGRGPARNQRQQMVEHPVEGSPLRVTMTVSDAKAVHGPLGTPGRLVVRNASGCAGDNVSVLVQDPLYNTPPALTAYAQLVSCEVYLKPFYGIGVAFIDKKTTVDFTASIRLYKNNMSLYVGIGITVAMLAAGAAIMYVWCRYRTVRPGYSAARTGQYKHYPDFVTGLLERVYSRDKAAAPDLTRTCNEYWMRPDNHYDMPQMRDSYASPFGNRSHQQSSAGSNHYEMKPYSPSAESASSCYTNSRTMTSRSSECSSQLAELVTSSPTSHSKVDVAVTLPPGPAESYRDKICLTIVK
ncbi:netrin receptor UNC5C like protein [Danaus plexippus plexippus]|uniref:Netrin receptor UNC5C like protein n=1 Tax=Danaus plexippus plexippus TaxID=278856 RepID=A0A212ETD5_DANPL|nr:netrin receptor UNC5C like protein [Danaus plexippus plexippus]